MWTQGYPCYPLGYNQYCYWICVVIYFAWILPALASGSPCKLVNTPLSSPVSQHFLTSWCHKTLTFHSPGSALGALPRGLPVPFSTELYLFLWHCDSLNCILIPTFPTVGSPLLFSSKQNTLTVSFSNSVGPGHDNGDMAGQGGRKSTEPRAERYFK